MSEEHKTVPFKLATQPVEVGEGMLSVAAYLRETAAMIEAGKVRAVGMCTVESGPDRDVTQSWGSMGGRITLTGALFQLMQEVSQA